MTDGFTRRKEHSKEDIRKAAWELFSQFGVEKVSIADIARKAGVSQATIYNNFGSKDALVREFVTTMIDQLANRAQQILSLDIPYWERMTTFIEFIPEIVAQGSISTAGGAVFNNILNLVDDSEIKNLREEAQEKLIVLLLNLVQEGKEQKQVRSDLSEVAFRLYIKAFMDMFNDPQFRHLYPHDQMLVHDLCSLILFGLGGVKKG